VRSLKSTDATTEMRADGPPDETGELARFGPYESPAGGCGALQATAKALREQSIVLKGSRALLSMNQPDGFDCPGCAWPDPKHTSSFEFCENGQGGDVRTDKPPQGSIGAYCPQTNPFLPLANKLRVPPALPG
jgi:hypothetical protein